MMATQADFGWELPDLSDIADGPDAFLQFADDVAGTIKDRAFTSYTPGWFSEGSTQPSNPATRTGFYRVHNGLCHFIVNLHFGAGTNGGTGALSVGLPLPATSVVGYQQIACYLWTPQASAVWLGHGVVDGVHNYTRIRPYFPVSNSRSDTLQWASSNGFLGLSVPSVPVNPGNSSVQNGGDFHAQGTYFIA
jgi:hypothetical protein